MRARGRADGGKKMKMQRVSSCQISADISVIAFISYKYYYKNK
jgi:hypothetical protein